MPQTITPASNKSSNHDRTPSLVALLQEIQCVHGYLPKDTVKKLARDNGIPLSKLFAAATFYNAFSLQPQGKHSISICHGTACHVQKSENIAAEIARTLELPEDEGTTDDLLFTVKKVRCLGCCSMAPVIKIDGTIYGSMTPPQAVNLIAIKKKGV